ncbi:type II toxin-antitoxin system RelE/ParE family toxin [Candidatus Nitrosotalea okcheonensis]|uniref:Putative Addiction module toxin RelE n=1 Tax=Candidatus Nitrosotalea okcheonensis TaxID=1903276 RepID=A0A2H1FHQ8_9ARCH|nr:hypothetical protein [Candidatus Nitrosotalea okcheonensis]SMH72222.1 putative Addiction module toxin RelE [Candidatus Nitrosotalea okcheonensis]
MHKVEARDGTIDKKLRKFRSDKAVIDGYFRILEELKMAQDPRSIGERKHGVLRNCYAIHLTKNHSLLYTYYPDQNLVKLIDLDDHKNLYGRDNRS